MDKKNAKTLKIFISSTYEDMKPYRNAVQDAITSIRQLPIGMEHFFSSSERSLDVCLADVRRCNIFVLIIGMRYGSLDSNTGKSYTELEYEEAIRNNIPVLAFVIDENECPVLPKYFDYGEKAEKLQQFKKRLDEAHMASRFKSVDDLKQLALLSIESQIKKDYLEIEKSNPVSKKDSQYLDGAKIYKKFILLPERYKNKEVILRVRIDGTFGTWKQRDVLFEAYGLPPGDAIRINDVFVIGVDFDDIDQDDSTIDLFAEGKAADWILENNVSKGSIIEGHFRLMYENVKNITHTGDAKIAAVLLNEGISVSNKK